MKKILLLIVLLSSGLFFAQIKDSLLIDKGIYKVTYSQIYEQPLRVTYTVLCSKGKEDRTGISFVAENGIKTSSDKDYEGNVYDKGHNAPSADFNCDKPSMIKTFSYINCSLQNQYLNRGAWRFLEAYERHLAEKYAVYVEIKSYFSEKSIRLPTGATVPDAFKKTIIYNGIKEVFFFKNSKPASNDFRLYQLK